MNKIIDFIFKFLGIIIMLYWLDDLVEAEMYKKHMIKRLKEDQKKFEEHPPVGGKQSN